jgi:hypothetical protein
MKPDRKTATLLPDVRHVRADDEHANASAEYFVFRVSAAAFPYRIFCAACHRT